MPWNNFAETNKYSARRHLRILMRAGLSLVSAFAWVFVFQYALIFSGSLPKAFVVALSCVSGLFAGFAHVRHAAFGRAPEERCEAFHDIRCVHRGACFCGPWRHSCGVFFSAAHRLGDRYCSCCILIRCLPRALLDPVPFNERVAWVRRRAVCSSCLSHFCRRSPAPVSLTVVLFSSLRLLFQRGGALTCSLSVLPIPFS